MPDKKTPPPPEKPTPNECCGSGCVPCIYDYYYDAYDKWHQQYGKNSSATSAESSSGTTQQVEDKNSG